MDRFDVAIEFLDTAELCLDNGKLRSAISRSYYAVFHACIVLFEHYNYSFRHFIGRGGRPATRWEHGIIIKHFLIEFVHKRQLMNWSVAVEVRRLYRSRIKADYRTDMVIVETLARESYTEAAKIISLIEEKVK